MRRSAIRVGWGIVALGVIYSVSVLAQAPQQAEPPPPAAPGTSVTIAPQNITDKDLLAGLANPARWLHMSGDYSGQRFSPLKQITPENAGQLAAQWTFQTGVGGKFEATPIVIDGIMYVSGILNHAWAIDGKTGKQIWHYQRQLPPPNQMKICCGTVNRGLAVYKDKLFMTTLDAHLVALDMRTGKVVWDVPISDYKLGHAATQTPLVVKDKLIVGIAGGEFAIRGFLDAYNPDNGQRIWRFWTVPAPNEPGGNTWSAESWERGGGPTWLTGSYDPALNLLYWGTGNPNPDFYGDNRPGDNLYTGSLIALDADSGTLKWHYQFTPHDTHDWDANQIPVLADLTIGGRARKVVMSANRNGFFYVLDRATGELLLAKPFVKTTWATEIGKDGRPIELPNQRPTPQGTLTCPDLYGGTNFNSPSFSPQTGLFYVSARETCMTYRSAAPREGYVAGVALAYCLMSALANDRPAAKDELKPASMRFEWRTEGPVENCGRNCRVWISAVGVVTEDTTRDFEVFAKDHDLRGATLVLDSEGGSVISALALGRAIRRLDMTTTVGKTAALPSSGDAPPRASLSLKANCELMCAFILLGGTRRYVPPEAQVLVHQIWLGNKAKRALESSYSAHELGVVQRDIGSLARYTVEMGGGIELLETALRVPPWEPMYKLSGEEIRRMQLTTVDRLFAPDSPAPTVAQSNSSALATAAQAQHRD